MGAAGLLDRLPSTVSCVVFSSDGVHYHHEGRLPFHGECVTFYGQPAHGKNTWDDEAQAKKAMAIFAAQRVKANNELRSFNGCLLAHATPLATRTPHPTARTSLAHASVHPVHPHLLDHRNLRKQLADQRRRAAASHALAVHLLGRSQCRLSSGQERFSQASRSPVHA